ncbi:MAG: MFS transporter [Nevskiaceae bacterium]|jgi:MFS family permease|nr:MFS transporter [Nevskiaceae bacterium]
MRAGSWPSIALIYLYGVLAGASLTKVIPLQQDFAAHIGMTLAQYTLLLSLLSIPSALSAAIVGGVIDRIGARTALICAAAAGALANFLYLVVQAPSGFHAVRLLEGVILLGVYSGAPGLIMATTSNERRGRAMALWSTYTPVGVCLGLVLSSHFAGTDNWRGGYFVHGSLFVVMALAGPLLLPRSPPRPPHVAGQKFGLLSAMTQPGPLRVALVFGTLVMAGFGVSSVFPAWYARQQQVSLGEASAVVGTLNLTMIAGGIITAWLLAHGFKQAKLFRVLIALGLLAALAMFHPALSRGPRLMALVAWMMTSGACIATVTAMLPRVVASPLQGAAAAGLLSQVGALTTFLTPYVWLPILGAGHWPLFIAVIAVAGIAGILLFPRSMEKRSWA